MPHRDHTSHKEVKDDRHSKTGVQGDPKKGGAGGHYTWGKAGDEVDADSGVNDPKDPNYEGDEKAPLPPVPDRQLSFEQVSKEVAEKSATTAQPKA